MTFLLSSDNVLDYLVKHHLLQIQDRALAQIEAKEYKNFNLVVTLATGGSLLVKQERFDTEKRPQCELWREQKIYELFQHFAEINDLWAMTSEVVYFDPDNFIIVLRYFSDYCNLSQFYAEHQPQVFPVAIAQGIGHTLATVHHSTWGQAAHQLFLAQAEPSGGDIARPPSFLQGLERFGPGIFSKISTDGLEFWRLYQRYDSLHEAMVETAESYRSNCLIHSDLEFRNILVKADGSDAVSPDVPLENASVKLIDWEFFRWGDPAYDLGIVLASYLGLWLESLVVGKTIPLQTALKLATTPLELLQPSMTALVQSYISAFPAILDHQPNFLNQVIQFTGLVLVKQIQSRLERLNPFDNTSVCTLQVAKMLLCSPDQSIAQVFGTSATNLTHIKGVLSC
jgi:Phosphotransferase enzyme family